MDEDLISKKDLLELANISYGQLYRWKRKNLIPEAWFIRKSTFTGQETFFPKDKILLRIDQIKNMKDGLSLDELADMFSPSPSEISLSHQEVVEQNIVTKAALDLFAACFPDIKEFSFEKLFWAYVVDTILQTGDISLEEGKMLLLTMAEHYAKYEDRNCRLILVRKLGVATCFLVSASSEVHFEQGARVVVECHLPTYVERLKLKVS